MPLVSKGVWVKGPVLTHSNGVNSKLDDAYFNAQDPKLQGGNELRLREREYHRTIACMAINGCTNKEIAEALDVSEHTVSQIKRQPFCQKIMIKMQREAGVDELTKIIQAGAQAVIRVSERAKDKTIDLAIRQKDDHLLVSGLLKVVSPDVSNRPVHQLSDAELTQIALQVQKTVNVESEVESEDENELNELNQDLSQQPSEETNQPASSTNTIEVSEANKPTTSLSLLALFK